MDDKKKSGIYQIRNIKNDKVYIGQSIDLDKRINNHKYHLKRNTHYNKALQNSFNKHGEDSFFFEVLEECNTSELDNKECFWISLFDSTNRECGYNFESGGNANKVMHKETIEKIRKTLQIKRLGKGNPMYGKKLTDERKEQIRLVNRGRSNKLTEEDVRKIKMALYLGISQTELVSLFNVQHSTINKIANSVNWAWVLKCLNDDIIAMYKQSEEERNQKINELFSEGVSLKEIAYIVRCDRQTVTRVVGVPIELIRKERNQSIINDFEQGMTQKEITKKYNLEESGIRRILSDAIQAKRSEVYNRVIELHNQGLKNIEIANLLNIHRTTVTEYIKGRIKKEKRKPKPLTDELKQQIQTLICEGKSQREVSRLLEISRNMIKKTLEGA